MGDLLKVNYTHHASSIAKEVHYECWNIGKNARYNS